MWVPTTLCVCVCAPRCECVCTVCVLGGVCLEAQGEHVSVCVSADVWPQMVEVWRVCVCVYTHVSDALAQP